MDRMNDDIPSVCPSPMSLIWAREADRIREAVDEGLSGKIRHIAIISEYLAGREDLITKIECFYPEKILKITLDSFIDDLPFFTEIPDADIIIIENCQFLIQRKINGFHLFSKFEEILLRKEKIWITTWNIHGWRYLNAIKGIGSLFPIQIMLNKKTNQELQNFILTQHISSIFYVIDGPVPRRLLIIRKNKKFFIPYTDKKFVLPYYRVRLRLLAAVIRRRSHEIEPAELIFERLSQVSNGNPGIALKIWETSLDAWEIRMSKLTPPSVSWITDPDTAYILSLIISLEIVQKSDLLSIVPNDISVSPILSKLNDNGIISIHKGRIFIEPIALAGITNEMKRIRMVW